LAGFSFQVPVRLGLSAPTTAVRKKKRKAGGPWLILLQVGSFLGKDF
jgi:hypothetical protein